MPRSGEAATGALGAEVGAAEDVATGAGAAGRASASTSSLRIRPPTPVPFTFARFTPNSDASFRTIGVTYASAGCVVVC